MRLIGIRRQADEDAPVVVGKNVFTVWTNVG